MNKGEVEKHQVALDDTSLTGGLIGCLGLEYLTKNVGGVGGLGVLLIVCFEKHKLSKETCLRHVKHLVSAQPGAAEGNSQNVLKADIFIPVYCQQGFRIHV